MGWLGQNLMNFTSSLTTTITIQFAIVLKKVGIQIKGIEGVLDEVCFCKRYLFLPIVKIR
jgi:hypothetical protein